MEKLLHVVEPTLEGEAGHCRSFIENFCRAGRGTGWKMTVWGGRKAETLDCPGTDVRQNRHFSRRIRRIQSLLLYRRLLRAPGRIFLPTAGRTDLFLLDLASGGTIPAGKVRLFFHWFRVSEDRLKFLRKIAGRQPNIGIIGSTQMVADPFRECGFPNVSIAPIPIDSSGGPVSPSGSPFRHILFAGAARQDKGISRVVDLAASLDSRGEKIRMHVQVSPDHYEKYDAATMSDVERLRAVRYPHLQIVGRTLAKEEYRDMFKGAICLQPYDRGEYIDRASGVTLDALAAGCPIVATSGTWMGKIVERFDAGMTVDELSPDELYSAVTAVVAGYGRFSRNAIEAGRVLLEEYGARHLFAEVTG